MTETEKTEQEPTMTDETVTEATEAPVAEPAATEAATDAAPEAPAKPARAAKAAAPKAPKAAASDEADRAGPAEAPADDAVAAAVADAPKPSTEPAPTASGPRGLRARYHADVVPALVKQFEYGNPNQVPRLQKIVVNVGLGEALSNAKAIDAASGDLILITGQKPIVMKARRSIAQFKIRTGNPIGLKVTLRGQRMWDFLERLTLLTLPRIRDFRGVPSRSFDGRGNYSLGMREQIAFPEIDYDKVDRLRGLEISVVTTAKSDEESKRLLELLGMPFAS
jgi:large subunit ribosomal protein L5